MSSDTLGRIFHSVLEVKFVDLYSLRNVIREETEKSKTYIANYHKMEIYG